MVPENIHTHLKGVIGNSKVRVVSKFLKEGMNQNCNYQLGVGGGEGGGGEGKELFKQKPLHWSGMDTFSLICSSNWALPGNIDIHSKKGWPLRGRGV